jgi:hypothetical protein
MAVSRHHQHSPETCGGKGSQLPCEKCLTADLYQALRDRRGDGQ